ncbi:hypothetical protein C942_00721 [Photobacterium marinum]|uniref:Lcl C-terminal domain-containing protein n=1 Tax=Photobacterium marinum TaxID=1056511 RepID=L8JBJ3_9GAMM|nr:DUF1566 domain-containing protein [Photobacterium marinum]ELR65638.1 hypothetical protein C942_00721 [Photobacterium marinum]
MKYQLSVLAAAMLVTGCNGVGDRPDESSPQYSISGRITAQVAQGNETVCADFNGDFVCDSDEPSASAKNGEFTIKSTNKAIYDVPLVVNLDTGVSTIARSAADSSTNALLVSPGQRKVTGNEINAVSTLVASQAASGNSFGDAVKSAKSMLIAMGLPATDNLLNEGSNSEYVTFENNFLSIVTALDKTTPDFSLVMLTQNLEKYKDVLMAAAPSDAELKRVIDNINGSVAKVALNDTGVATYYTDSVDKTQPSTDYPGQDAELGFDKTDNGFKFVKLDKHGKPLPDAAAEWSCVKDARTGLIWESKKNDENSIQHFDRLYAYQVADKFEPYIEDLNAASCKAKGDDVCTTEQYVKYLNEQQVCGINTWRLPTYYEFYDLIDFGETETDDGGEVYGLTYKYFPLQSIASDVFEGEVWTSTDFYTEYSDQNSEGGMYISIIQTRGDERGQIYMDQILSNKAASDNSTSYQLPIRLVSKESNN